ncbi:MAG TPA: hypothetical protein VHM93_09000, partial [Candidatus Acidoferrum sp.]|nr:hypothetical protein [Candidatus Acidoferrum sp.]
MKRRTLKDPENDLSQLNRLGRAYFHFGLLSDFSRLYGAFVGAEAPSQLSTSAQVLAKSQELTAKSFICT